MDIGDRIPPPAPAARADRRKNWLDRCAKLFLGLHIASGPRFLTSPSIATLVDILESLGTDLKTFFSESGDEKLVFGEKDISVKEDERSPQGLHQVAGALGAEEPHGADPSGTRPRRRDG